MSMMRTMCAVLMCKARLDDFEFWFSLHTFNGIFEYSDGLFSVLEDKKMDVQFCLARMKEFCDTVEQDRSLYEEIYEATEHTAGAPRARRGPAQNPRAHYRQLHGRILDNIIDTDADNGDFSTQH